MSTPAESMLKAMGYQRKSVTPDSRSETWVNRNEGVVASFGYTGNPNHYEGKCWHVYAEDLLEEDKAAPVTPHEARAFAARVEEMRGAYERSIR